jgi:hypothetical protein
LLLGHLLAPAGGDIHVAALGREHRRRDHEDDEQAQHHVDHGRDVDRAHRRAVVMTGIVVDERHGEEARRTEREARRSEAMEGRSP